MSDRNNPGGGRPIQEEQLAQQNQLVVHTSNVIDAAVVREVLDFDFSTLRQHPVLTIEKTDDNVQMIIDLDFTQAEPAPGIGALLQALMDYAAIIYDVKIFIEGPKHHHDAPTCKCRLANVALVMTVLNKFNLKKAEVIACLDDHDSYQQLELTIAAYKLNFRNWTLAYEVAGLDGKWDIPVGSEDELRLRRLYRKYFLKKL
ncbi:hypothetical protein BOTCAL_0210g00150 [Botryotinia calthae]|uniref:Uncharacterized protein n=1 Tax=Botryotinia calthae TaxID=38488 RepID=A0A4Y8D195_9HELO|nr:hypothetical protein BOTCAL_0210g00150 [Botryotinia calthae]